MSVWFTIFCEQEKWKPNITLLVGNKVDDYKNIGVLATTISSGIRKRFTLLSKDILYNQVVIVTTPLLPNLSASLCGSVLLLSLFSHLCVCAHICMHVSECETENALERVSKSNFVVSKSISYVYFLIFCYSFTL